MLPSAGFCRPEYWSGQPFPSPGDLPDSEIESRSPASRVDSLPAEPQGKPVTHRTAPQLRTACPQCWQGRGCEAVSEGSRAVFPSPLLPAGEASGLPPQPGWSQSKGWVARGLHGCCQEMEARLHALPA